MIKKITDYALIGLAVLFSCITVAYIFFNLFVDQTTIGTNNVSDQIAIDVKAEADLSAEEKDLYEERWFMEANYYSNAKNNGVELQELNFNYFTSYHLTEADYRATGMQYVGDFETYTYRGTDEELEMLPNFYFYDTTDGISFSGYSGTRTQSISTLLTRDTALIIKIDGRPFTIQMTGSYSKGWWIFGSTWYYDYGDLFQNVFDAIESNSAGFGDYYITLDLSYFFEIREMDSNGKFLADNVSDVLKNYAVLKFHYDENGAYSSEQSMFGQIECNSKYDRQNVEFWNAKTVYTLDETDLKYRYSEAYDGYFVSLSNEMKLLFEEVQAYDLYLNLNFASDFILEKEYNVIGFDYNAFSGFDIHTLTVKGVNALKVLPNSFENATLRVLKHSNILFDGAFGVDFAEVIL